MIFQLIVVVPCLTCTIPYLPINPNQSRTPFLPLFPYQLFIDTMDSSGFSHHFPRNFTCVHISSVTYLQLYNDMKPLLFRSTIITFLSLYTAYLPQSSSQSQCLASLFCPLIGTNVTLLQDSLFVTDCYYTPISHRHTSLLHNRSPKNIGGLL